MGIHRALYALPLLAACGGDMSGLTGIYDINTWTENTTACDSEGPPKEFVSETALYIKEENFFGSFLNVVPCADIADCETMAGDDDTIHLGNWGFTEGNDDDGWTETSAYAFQDFNDPTLCDATGTDTIMTTPAEGTIRIEVRTSHAEDYPATGPNDDPCPDEAAEAAVAGQPCDSYEVVSATFNEGLP